MVILAQFALGGSRNQRGKGAIMRFRKKENFFSEKFNVLQKRKKYNKFASRAMFSIPDLIFSFRLSPQKERRMNVLVKAWLYFSL